MYIIPGIKSTPVLQQLELDLNLGLSLPWLPLALLQIHLHLPPPFFHPAMLHHLFPKQLRKSSIDQVLALN